jgi:hypothetical protein
VLLLAFALLQVRLLLLLPLRVQWHQVPCYVPKLLSLLLLLLCDFRIWRHPPHDL